MKKPASKTVAVLKPAQKPIDEYGEALAVQVERILCRRADIVSAKKELADAEEQLRRCHNWPDEATKQHREKIQRAREAVHFWENSVDSFEKEIVKELPWWPCLFPAVSEPRKPATVRAIGSLMPKRRRAVSK